MGEAGSGNPAMNVDHAVPGYVRVGRQVMQHPADYPGIAWMAQVGGDLTVARHLAGWYHADQTADRLIETGETHRPSSSSRVRTSRIGVRLRAAGGRPD